jgi:hypothetical protein
MSANDNRNDHRLFIPGNKSLWSGMVVVAIATCIEVPVQIAKIYGSAGLAR